MNIIQNQKKGVEITNFYGYGMTTGNALGEYWTDVNSPISSLCRWVNCKLLGNSVDAYQSKATRDSSGHKKLSSLLDATRETDLMSKDGHQNKRCREICYRILLYVR